jgi:HTH-type transcriptional regulator/antitoxin HigA
MAVTAIRTEDDYRAAMAAIDGYIARLGNLSEEEDRDFEALSILVADYEERHYAIPDIDPIEFLEQHMLEFGRKQKDMAAVIGSTSLASHIMNRHRPMSLDVIRALSEAWHIPLSILAEPYELERKRA